MTRTLTIGAAALVALSAAPAATAMADPKDELATTICVAIYRDPTDNGIITIGQALIDAGATEAEAGKIVYRAVDQYCPNFMFVVDTFIEHYA